MPRWSDDSDVDWADVEGDAILLYRRAGHEPDRPVPVGRLVRELLGTEVQRAALAGRREGEICRLHGRHVIAVRRGIPGPRARWVAAHELAHWWTDEVGYRGDDSEAWCDALGAALICPRPAWLALRRRVGPDVHELAAALATTQSLALLRLGECEGTPAALVEPRRVLVRGWSWEWPEEEQVRRAARLGHPALRKVPITDEWSRTGLLAAA